MSFGDKAKQLLATFAPLVGTALGGPLGGMAGSMLASVLGTKPGDDKATEAALLSASPEQLVALRKVEADFQTKMKELEVSEDQLQYQDMASARQREIAVKDHVPAVLAYGVTIGFFTVLGYVIHFGIKTLGSGQGGEAVLIMLGSLGTAWGGIMAYYFGSSAGAKRNAEVLAKIATAP